MKRIYIAGCGGMLGEAFYKIFKDDYKLKCTDKDVNENWLSFLDFTFFSNYLNDVRKFNPDYLFHIGACTDMEYCENNADYAYQNNYFAVEDASYIANVLDIPLLYISTSTVFNGDKSYYSDLDEPNPRSVYAQSKYLGEKHIIDNVEKYLICRAGWMMGGYGKDKKFVGKIVGQINEGKKELIVVGDKKGSLTLTYDFARNVKMLIEKELWGIYNIVCGGSVTRIDIAREIVKIMNVDVKIKETTSDYFDNDYHAPRPLSERLMNKELNNLGLNLMRNWKESLCDYLNGKYL